MRYRRLGSTGLEISAIVLGAASFGDTVDTDAVHEVVAAALDAGVTTFDTADAYAGGRSEEILGRALAGQRREDIVVCSKVGLRPGDADADHAAIVLGRADHAERWRRGISPSEAGLSRKHVLEAVEATLTQLRTDYLDLYQVHRFDPDVPLEETLGALDDLVRAGKVRYLGCSGFAAWQLFQALWVSDRRGLARFESLQVRYNISDRVPEQAVLPAAVDAGVGVLAYQVLAGGVLTGRADTGGSQTRRRSSRPSVAGRYVNADVIGRAERLRSAVQEVGISPAAACVGWALSRPGVTAAVVGASSPDQLAGLISGVETSVPEHLLDQLSAFAVPA
ncbi:aldo/keto reductase [Blastococcus sp. URHD0036]|uniref:aldo/keto reductase n=1 Tax=Blastococcus sp. URHD0036 TaxID=1380356 RepID=UPI000495088B|nr:aldo/keto reductase [Blastococcus sp. URHD0036]